MSEINGSGGRLNGPIDGGHHDRHRYGGPHGRSFCRLDEEVKPLSGKVRSTLNDVGKLARHVDGKVDPISKSVMEALKSRDTAFKSIDGLVGKRSQTRAEIDKTLKEIQKAARSVRLLADYLEQHPEALLKGKGSRKY
jgi:paraquat-inducible protein B